MTEAEWLAGDPDRLDGMFLHIRSPHDRKQRLAVIAVLRVLATRFPGPRVDRLLAAYEDLADHRDRGRFLADLGGLSPSGDDLGRGDAVFRGAVRAGVRGFGNGRDCRVAEIRLAPGHRAHSSNHPYDGPDHRREAVAVVRDIFGNPFRPVAADDRWRTIATVALAKMMYDTRGLRSHADPGRRLAGSRLRQPRRARPLPGPERRPRPGVLGGGPGAREGVRRGSCEV